MVAACNCRTSESQQFLFYIFRNLCIVRFTYIVSVDSECRKSFLCMCSQYGCKVNCSRSLCSVESPYSFDRHRIHIHCLCAVAPAWCNCQSNVNALFLNLSAHAADSATRPIVVSAMTTFTGSPFVYLKFSSNSFAADFAMFIVCSSRDSRTFSTSSSVNCRSDTNYRVVTDQS